MYPGDDPTFANPTFNDSQWLPVDLNRDIQDFLPLRERGIIWLRLKVNVDSAIAVKQLSAHIVQYTASEVYLNGKLLHRYGTISSDPKKVSAYLPSPQPLPIYLQPGDNFFAVRLAYEPRLPYISILNGPLHAFDMYINNQKAANANYDAEQRQSKIYVIIFSVSTGTLMIIGLIYLIYFLFDRSRKVNLYYSMSMLALSLNAFPIEVWGADRYGKISLAFWIFFFEGTLLTTGMLFMLLTIYTLFQYYSRSVFRILLLLAVVVCIGMYTYGTAGFFIISFVFPVICLLEAVHVCWWAIRQKKKDAGIILSGIILYIVFTLWGGFFNTNSISAQLLFYMAQMFFPIGMSFYLGIQSSLINQNLKATLKEVQSLSEKNIMQEQEKQQLLANQNELLEKQVNERTAELNHSLQELKSTQSQLIQSEKMASLGELTAGIAHEIQNPLNFVNNFSEVNTELIEELVEEVDKGNITEVKAIANDIKENEQKINHHGKRADAIVKGMLQHSRSSTSTKEPTDINKLADEYLRLAYHGLRAKDKSFNATLKTDYDETIGNINIIPQDIGRVILNLITNAFYVVDEKKKSGIENYEPTVSVSTKKMNNKIEISVKDNGNGIPQKILDKIFQPFFTTKPTGQGTGLGLSLSYDIVKAHGGELKVETKEARPDEPVGREDGTTFIIELPIA